MNGHGGTLFLDEIGDISPAFQAKLQEREDAVQSVAGDEELEEAAQRPEDGERERLLKISPRQMGYALQKHEVEVCKF